MQAIRETQTSMSPQEQKQTQKRRLGSQAALGAWLCYFMASSLAQAQQFNHFIQQQQVSALAQAPSSTSHPNGPTIIPFSFNQNVQENQRAIVMCTTSSGEIPVNFTWSKDGQLLTQTIAQSKRIQIKNDLDSSTLKISTVRLEHAGNYTCVARNRHASQSHQAQLIVHGEPRWLREPPLEPLVATRGQTVVIDCQTTGWPKPQQSWQVKSHTQGEFEPLNFGGRVSLAPNGSLVIRQADKTDEANYVCKSFNGIGRGLSWSTSLKVTVPAHFDAAPANSGARQQAILVRRENQVQLRCDAYGDPPITIEWYRNKQLLPVHDLQEPRYSIHSNNNPLKNGLISQLLIKQAQRADNALFECVTKNPYGRDRQPMELVVQERPDSIQELQLTQAASRSVTLVWQEPYDGRSPIVSYMFQYRRLPAPQASGAPEHPALPALVAASALAPMGTFDYLGGGALGALEPQEPADSSDWQQASRLMFPVSQQVAEQANQSSVRSLTIDKLEPSSRYLLRALAINAIGQGKFSQPMEFATDEEAPEVGPVNISASAINSTAIQVGWDEIPVSKHLGRIHGYYIGYRVASNNSAAANFVYKPVMVAAAGEASSQQQQSARLESVLTELKRDTQYEITVVAFNSRGSGPSSDFVLCKTIEMEAPKHVRLAIRREANDSILIEWHRDPTDQNPVDDYTLYQEKNSASKEWLQVRLPGNQTQYRASALKCGTRYQFYLIAQNKVGKSQPSEVVSASTSGSLPAIPSKSALITKLNSTCLLVNLNSFQDNSCRIKTFTVRYRVEKLAVGETAPTSAGASLHHHGAAAGALSSGSSGPTGTSSAALNAAGASKSASGAQLASGSAGAPGTASAPAAAAGQTAQSGLASAAGAPAGAQAQAAGVQSGDWITVRPRSARQQHLFGGGGGQHQHHHHQQHYQTGSGHAHWLSGAGPADEDRRMEYLCELSPSGEYTIHVAATNDVGRSEIEYTVLMSSDELRHSLLRELADFFAALPSVFAFIPSAIVFLLAGLLLGLVCLILGTIAYQKLIIMRNQMRATQRAKADERRRRKLAYGGGRPGGAGSRHNNSSKQLELWADEYEDELDDEPEAQDDGLETADDEGAAQIDDMRCPIMGAASVSADDDGGISDELNTSTTASTVGACSSSGGSSMAGARRAVFHYPQHSSLSAGGAPPFAQHKQRSQQQHSKRRRQRHSVHRAYPAASARYYLSNIASSAFDTSSIDTQSGAGRGCSGPAVKCAGSTCMSSASTESIQGRFQCLSAKQYVKMNEYTMLPSISAALNRPLMSDIYGTTTSGAPRLAPAGSINQSPVRGLAGSTASSASGSPSSQLTHNQPGDNNSLYCSTLRRATNMQTYLPARQQQRQSEASNSSSGADVYGYYMAPPMQQQQHSVASAMQAAQQAANEAAHSIFVPPQGQKASPPQIVYSAPNIRRQVHHHHHQQQRLTEQRQQQQQQTSPQVFL